MSKIIKVVAGAFGLIALFMMFLPQVSIHWNIGTANDTLGIAALVGGTYPHAGTEVTNPVGTGLAGYILAGVAGLLFLAVAFVPFFKEHDVLNYLVTGVAIICLIIAIIMLFLIRKNFADANGFESDMVYVGAGAIIGGSLASLAAAAGGLGLVVDLAK